MGDRFFRLLLAGVVATYFFTAPSASAGDPPLRLVMVTSAHSRIGSLSHPMLRKIYLGSSPGVTSQVIHPLINQSNRMLHEVFLQKVLFMSIKTYERHLRHKKLSSDTVLPVAYRSEARLIEYLNAHPDSITCLTEQVAAQLPSVRVVTRL